MRRYAVYADGFQIGHAETKEKAWKIAHKYECECMNQDEPCYPKMEVQKEVIE